MYGTMPVGLTNVQPNIKRAEIWGAVHGAEAAKWFISCFFFLIDNFGAGAEKRRTTLHWTTATQRFGLVDTQLVKTITVC